MRRNQFEYFNDLYTVSCGYFTCMEYKDLKFRVKYVNKNGYEYLNVEEFRFRSIGTILNYSRKLEKKIRKNWNRKNRKKSE